MVLLMRLPNEGFYPSRAGFFHFVSAPILWKKAAQNSPACTPHQKKSIQTMSKAWVKPLRLCLALWEWHPPQCCITAAARARTVLSRADRKNEISEKLNFGKCQQTGDAQQQAFQSPNEAITR